MGGEKLGWWAAIIFTLSLQTFVHAKAAVADMWLVLFVTLASWAGYELFQRPTLNPGSGGLQTPWAIWKSPFLVFYLALALGFLAKGPIAWTPLLTVAVLIIYTRDWQMLRRFKFAVWCCADACSGRALGNPGADSNTRGVFQSGNRTTRRSAVRL